MRIRKAKDEDTNKIAEVLFESGLAKTYDEGEEMYVRETRKGDKYIVAEEDEEILGIITWVFQGAYRHELSELYHIGVKNKARGKGVAQALFWKLIYDINKIYREKGQQLRKLYLLTHDDNTVAQKFYEKVGMTHEATLRDHFYSGKPERVYSIFFEKDDPRLTNIEKMDLEDYKD